MWLMIFQMYWALQFLFLIEKESHLAEKRSEQFNPAIEVLDWFSKLSSLVRTHIIR